MFFLRLSLSKHKELEEKIFRGSLVGDGQKTQTFVQGLFQHKRLLRPSRLTDMSTVTRLVKEGPGSPSSFLSLFQYASNSPGFLPKTIWSLGREFYLLFKFSSILIYFLKSLLNLL